MHLISKVQYKRSEKGEFHEIAERNFEETVSLIRNYPWNTERSFASIELTCPSVTIEHSNGSYLKIGPYFSGKFSLYYLDSNEKVYLKIVNVLDDICGWIKIYFEQGGNLQGFDNYTYAMKAASHFRTKSFEYTINTEAIMTFFRFPIYMSPVIFIMWSLKTFESAQPFDLAGLATLMILFLAIISGPLIYLFFNYLSADKDRYLKISKGHDDFLYGSVEDIKSYSKQNIAEINGYGVRHSKSPWNECELFIIRLKNGERIEFTSLLINGEKLKRKLPDHQIINNKKFFPTVESLRNKAQNAR